MIKDDSDHFHYINIDPEELTLNYTYNIPTGDYREMRKLSESTDLSQFIIAGTDKLQKASFENGEIKIKWEYTFGYFRIFESPDSLSVFLICNEWNVLIGCFLVFENETN